MSPRILGAIAAIVVLGGGSVAFVWWRDQAARDASKTGRPGYLLGNLGNVELTGKILVVAALEADHFLFLDLDYPGCQ